MNIRYLQKLLSRVDEIKIIGKKSEIDDIVFNVAGILRYGQQLRLIMLEYNEQYCQQIEEREISDLCNVRQTPASNRISLKSKEIVTQYFRLIRQKRTLKKGLQKFAPKICAIRLLNMNVKNTFHFSFIRKNFLNQHLFIKAAVVWDS